MDSWSHTCETNINLSYIASFLGYLPFYNYVEEGMEDTRRAWPTESTKQDSHGLTETKAASVGSAWLCTRSYVHVQAVTLVFL